MSTFFFSFGFVTGAAFVALMWWISSSGSLDIEGDLRERSD